ncbi:hypothetical protein CPZ87_28765 [Piscinibacter gummiphilus]|nr:hypothetical protein CPZ87_28765 [Piscinibacter gummiphilus]
MFGGWINPGDATTSPLFTVVVAVIAMFSPAVQACGPGGMAAALQAPTVATKFALAREFCVTDEGTSTAVAPRSPDTSRYAEQLWLYDRPAVRTPEAALPEPVRASPPVAAPTASVIRSSAPVAGRPIRGVSREASARALSLVPQISDVAARFRIDPLLLHAIAHVESRHNPDAVSHAGALGLMQVMPATARRFGVTSPKAQLHDPKISLEVSSAYLKTLQRRFDNNLTLVIAAYNAGEGAVEKYGRQVPPYKETQGYVRDVMAHYRALLSLRDAGATPAPARPML